MEPNIRIKGFDGDWEERSLGDIYTERNERGNDSLQILSVSIHDGVSDGELDEEGLGKVVRRSEDKSTYKHVYEGDLVFNMMRAWQGAIGVVKTEGMISPAYISAIPNASVYPPFMDYVLRRKEAIDQINNLSYGVTDFRKRLYWDSFVKVKCHRPSVEEQKRITDTLESLDRYTLLNQRQCDDLKELKKYMLQKMFPKDGEKVPEIRFSGFDGEWEQRKFVSVFDGLQNNTLSRAELNYESGTVKTVHYGDVLIKFGDYIDVSETVLPYISDDAIADKFKKSFLQDGDIVIADTAEDDTVGKCTEIQGSEGVKLLSGLHTIACRPKKKYGHMFLGYYINSPAYHSQLKPLMQGIKVTSISRSALQDTDLIVPKSIEEQTRIGAYFSQLDSLITHHQRRHDTLLEFKAYLLQNMFPKEG